MRRCLLVGILLGLAMGCAAVPLARNTVRQSSTMTDLRYRQVLDNLAMFLVNPDMLPFFSGIGTGTAVVSDTGTTDVTFWNPGSLMPFAELKGRRQLTENWTLSPVYDGDRLEAMRCAYQMLLFGPARYSGECAKQLRKFLPEEDIRRIYSGWFSFGCKKKVPKKACFVGCYHGTYAWVMPEGIQGLSNFTLAILDIATVEPIEVKRPVATKTVETYKYNAKTGKLEEVTRLTQEVPTTPRETTPLRFPRKNLYNPLQSQLFALPTGR